MPKSAPPPEKTAQEHYQHTAQRQAEAHTARDGLERAFLDAQAGLLARQLEEGVPCPVCGSTHHPAPAQLPHTAPHRGAGERRQAHR